jgi:hypothetical protein
MRIILRLVPAFAVALATMACNLPRLFGTPTPEFAALETAAQQTLSARLTQGVPTATAPLAVPSATLPGSPGAPATVVSATAPSAALTVAVDIQATAVAQAVSATQAALAATYTAAAPRPLPPQPLPPQPLPPQPIPPQPVPSAGRIRFAQGATSGLVSGQIPGRGGLVEYLVSAGRGQTMLASVFSPNNDVYLGVAGVADGVPLLRPAAGQTAFTGLLPATQDYRLTLAGPPGSSFTLQVIIPARIQFALGAISAAIPGQLASGEVNYYLAGARQGQTMTARILSPYNDIFLTIYGMSDGSPLVRSVMGQSSWSGVLPLTQDYMIQAVSTGASSGYSLEVIIQ